MLYLLRDNLESVVCKGTPLKLIRTTWLYEVCQSLRDSRTEQGTGFDAFKTCLQSLFQVCHS